MKIFNKLIIIGLACSFYANADDIDIYFQDPLVNEDINPNVLFIIDTSGSMGTIDNGWNVATTYEPINPETEKNENHLYLYALTYPGGIKTLMTSIPRTNFTTDCLAEIDATINNSTSSEGSAYLIIPENNPATSQDYQELIWYSNNPGPNNDHVYLDDHNPARVDCGNIDNNGRYNDPNVLIRRHPDHTNLGTKRSTRSNIFIMSADRHVYLQDYRKTRMQKVKSVMRKIINKYSNLDFSLMKFNYGNFLPNNTPNNNLYGGHVLIHDKKLSDPVQKEEFLNAVETLPVSGNTPLAVTLYEAMLYLTGGQPLMGHPVVTNNPSVAASYSGSGNSIFYNSPIEHVCQKETNIIYLSDGVQTADAAADRAFDRYLTSGNTHIFRDYAGNMVDTAEDSERGIAAYKPSLVRDLIAQAQNGRACAFGVSGLTDCLSEIATVLGHTDLRFDDADDIRGYDESAGNQKLRQYAKVHTVAFYDTIRPEMEAAAENSGGKSFEAEDEAGLLDTLDKILRNIGGDAISFTPPTLSTRSFNALNDDNFAYLSLFEPSTTSQWVGNIKRYSTQQLLVTDPSSQPETDGFFDCSDKRVISNSGDNKGKFEAGVRSFWSAEADGPDISKGGALAELTKTYAGNSRNLYVVEFPDAPIISPTSNGPLNYIELGDDNTFISEKYNGTGDENTFLLNQSTVSVDSQAALDKVIDWYLEGYIPVDNNGETLTDDEQFYIGDMIHSSPMVIQYDINGADIDKNSAEFCEKGSNIVNKIVVAGTNNGFIHAFDAQDGKELFAIMPDSLVGNLKQYKEDTVKYSNRDYGIDGEPVLYIKKNESSNKDKIEAAKGDRVFYYQGMRRGGDKVFALDLTNFNTTARTLIPKVMWEIDGSSDAYLEVAQTWSKPELAKIKWPCTNNATEVCDKAVLFMGGGYDGDQDRQPVVSETTNADGSISRAYATGENDIADDDGRALYMIDAESGKKLWSVTKDSDADRYLGIGKMKNSFPARVTPVDLNRDGYTDALFAVDIVGRLFRFDFNPAVSSSNDFAVGGLIAELGWVNSSGTNFARFFNAPDVAKMRNGLLSIAMGTGMRFSPNNTDIIDRSIVVFDHSAGIFSFNTFDTATSDASKADLLKKFYYENDANDGPLTNSDLTELTSFGIPAAADRPTKGWYRDLAYKLSADKKSVVSKPDSGEKILTPSITFNGCVFVGSYNPPDAIEDHCDSRIGTQRAYLYRALDGASCDAERDSSNNIYYQPFKELGIPGIPSEPWIKFSIVDGKQQVFGGIGNNVIFGKEGGGARGGLEDYDDKFQRVYWREEP